MGTNYHKFGLLFVFIIGALNILTAQTKNVYITSFLNKKETELRRNYIGKPLGNLFKDPLIKKSTHQFSNEPPGKIYAVTFYFQKIITITAFLPYPLKHQNTFNATLNWDIGLLKKEIIRDIKVVPYQ